METANKFLSPQQIQKAKEFIASICLKNEEWRPLYGIENHCYYVSTAGRICSFCRSKPQLLKQQLTGSNYYYVKIHNKNQRVHHLVARTFLEKPAFGQYQIHHKDGNALNNSLSNLEYLTPKEHQEKHKILNAAAAPQKKKSSSSVVKK